MKRKQLTNQVPLEMETLGNPGLRTSSRQSFPFSIIFNIIHEYFKTTNIRICFVLMK